MPPIHKENICKSCQSVKPTLGYHKCTPQDNQEKCCEKCNYTQRTAEDFCKYKFCPCHSPVSKEYCDRCFCSKNEIPNCKILVNCPCHSPKEETTSEWEEEYFREIAPMFKPSQEHLYEYIKFFIKSQISKATLQTKAEIVEMIEEMTKNGGGGFLVDDLLNNIKKDDTLTS